MYMVTAVINTKKALVINFDNGSLLPEHAEVKIHIVLNIDLLRS
jgi:hypothetical protein